MGRKLVISYGTPSRAGSKPRIGRVWEQWFSDLGTPRAAKQPYEFQGIQLCPSDSTRAPETLPEKGQFLAARSHKRAAVPHPVEAELMGGAKWLGMVACLAPSCPDTGGVSCKTQTQTGLRATKRISVICYTYIWPHTASQAAGRVNSRRDQRSRAVKHWLNWPQKCAKVLFGYKHAITASSGPSWGLHTIPEPPAPRIAAVLRACPAGQGRHNSAQGWVNGSRTAHSAPGGAVAPGSMSSRASNMTHRGRWMAARPSAYESGEEMGGSIAGGYYGGGRYGGGGGGGGGAQQQGGYYGGGRYGGGGGGGGGAQQQGGYYGGGRYGGGGGGGGGAQQQGGYYGGGRYGGGGGGGGGGGAQQQGGYYGGGRYGGGGGGGGGGAQQHGGGPRNFRRNPEADRKAKAAVDKRVEQLQQEQRERDRDQERRSRSPSRERRA
ncbi:MAG: hypothetical protein J3K34DRAFT_462082 [Monoraphidium minutum]|nr:MAG: hypothetical protein J3K34DRAFT_462082 [Monoraphidium minutum]